MATNRRRRGYDFTVSSPRGHQASTAPCLDDGVPRILIIDDEPDLVRLLDYNLKQAGFETETASTGEAALVAARARRPDLIVLDLMLPDLSGTEVCRQLRRDNGLKGVPIVMLTAKSE